jgi:acyl-coenzyme A synthetase/AMP-(fatty) acid ligase
MFGLVRGKQVPAILPMFWIGGLMMYLMPNWQAGATTVCTEKTLSNSRMAMGSVLSEDDLKAMSNQPPPWWGLGMTETLGPYCYGDEFRAPGHPVCAPMDHIADGYEVRVADEHNRPVGDGEVGEMQIRGYPMTNGLHKVERSDYLTDDGYYRTGDMCLLEGTRLLFAGRAGDMIKTAGSNVSPAEVELELQAIDSVHNAYVVGLPDRERGQLVVAAVVAREGTRLDFGTIEETLRRNLSSYKVPRAYVEISRDEVPMLHSNKIARRQIEQLMSEKLGHTA